MRYEIIIARNRKRWIDGIVLKYNRIVMNYYNSYIIIDFYKHPEYDVAVKLCPNGGDL